ncbi:glycoside hydrolase family 1 protein [Corynebacterium auriscanis]|uniref:glycoside hydrolase family 1 protein n=1 Tax=Corynebacterium auriscanis TaxID=99807 RepID=UPI003CE96669
MSQLSHPVGFSIGTASAALQIEGSLPANNWSRWADQGHVLDGTSPDVTTDHWNRWREDNRLMEELSLQIARISVEWARIEPRRGEFDFVALDRYAAEIADLKERGIAPLVTLHHFGHPLWFEDLGAFTREENVSLFLRYVRTVIQHLGDVVDDWMTINEPNVFATQAYLFRESPPGKTSWPALLRTLRNMAVAHIRAYQLIHEALDSPQRQIKVAFAHHVRVFAPLNPKNPLHRVFTTFNEWAFNRVVEKAFLTGAFSPLLGKAHTAITPGHYADAIGINYYSRTAVRGPSDGTFPNADVNDLGWEVYPQGLVDVSRRLSSTYQLPIWITENGTADNGSGEPSSERFRCRFLLDHLTALSDAHAQGVPIERYYHWCFIDNWEWTEGMAQRFGIVGMEPGTLNRVVKPSGYMLRDIIKSGGITRHIREQYTEPGGYLQGVRLSQPGFQPRNRRPWNRVANGERRAANQNRPNR